MRKMDTFRMASLGLFVGCVVFSACGKNGLHTTGDAAADADGAAGDHPTSDGVPPVKEDLPPTRPDLPPTPDLPPSDPAPGPDLTPPGDLPSDPFTNPDRAEASPPDLNLLDTELRDLNRPFEGGIDLPSPIDLPPVIEVRPIDLGGPDELVRRPDAYIGADGPAADLCTGSGGTVSTQLCCSSAADFRDTCTTATGACGCAPSSSITVDVCTCPNGGCFLPGLGCVGPAGTCTVGADQSCNDSPMISSIHGKCVTGGRCLCTTFALSATSGKCL